MSVLISSRCKAVRQLLQRTTEAATALSVEDLPTLSLVSSRGHIVKLCKIQVAILEANGKLTAEQLASHHASVDHTQFVIAFTKLITALTPLFVTLELTTDFGSSCVQVHLFLKLWDLLLASCQAFSTWPTLFPKEAAAANTALHAALAAFTTWLLTFTRASGGGWEFLHACGTLAQREAQAWCVLNVPSNCLLRILAAQARASRETLDYAYSLPCTFVATVCCLMCEQLSDALPSSIKAAQAQLRSRQAAVEVAVAAANAKHDDAKLALTSPARAEAQAALTAAAAATAELKSALEVAYAASAVRTQGERGEERASRFFCNMTICVTSLVIMDLSEGSSTLLGLYGAVRHKAVQGCDVPNTSGQAG